MIPQTLCPWRTVPPGMMDTVPRSSETEAVYLDLTRRMESGELPIGTRLPGEDVLATRYGASRGAIRRALQHLADAGLTETRAGRGTFVVSAFDHTRFCPPTYFAFVQ